MCVCVRACARAVGARGSLSLAVALTRANVGVVFTPVFDSLCAHAHTRTRAHAHTRTRARAHARARSDARGDPTVVLLVVAGCVVDRERGALVSGSTPLGHELIDRCVGVFWVFLVHWWASCSPCN